MAFYEMQHNHKGFSMKGKLEMACLANIKKICRFLTRTA